MVNPGHAMDVESRPVIIPDNFLPYPVGSFCIPSFYAEDIESVLIPEGLVRDRIKGLAREVFTTYAKSKDDAEPLVLVCVLKSAFKFFYALQQELEILNTEENGLGVTRSVLQDGNSDGPINGKNGVTQSASNRVLPLLCEFIRVKSYVNTTSEVNNSVQIQGLLDPGQTFSQKHVLIVEDIIDSGRTMQSLLQNLEQYNTKSIRVASLLWKRLVHGDMTVPFRPNFYGFEIPDRFVIGFGLDYNERYRDLNHLCIINATGIAKYAVQPSQ